MIHNQTTTSVSLLFSTMFFFCQIAYGETYRSVSDGLNSDCSIWEVEVDDAWVPLCSSGIGGPDLTSNDIIYILNAVTFPGATVMEGNTEVIVDGGTLTFSSWFALVMGGSASMQVINGGTVRITSSFLGRLVSSGNNSITLDGGSTMEIETYLESSGNLQITLSNGSTLLIKHNSFFNVSSALGGNSGIVAESGSTLSVLDPAFFPGGDLNVLGNATISILEGALFEAESTIALTQNGKIVVDGLGVFEKDVIAPGTADFTTTLTPPEITAPIVYVNGPLGCAGWDGPIGALGDPSCTIGQPLPVVLLSFEGHWTDGLVTLVWETAEEENNDFFTVLRSSDAMDYHSIGQVDGMGTTSETQVYTFIDDKPLVGTNYYQLVQTDFDGTTERFGPVVVQVAPQEEALRIYPNPLDQGTFNLQLSGFESGAAVTLQITDLTGRTVYADQWSVRRAGAERVAVSLPAQIEKGTYLVSVIGDNRRYTGKLVKAE